MEVYIALVLMIRLLQRVIPTRECHKMGEMSQCSVVLLFIRYTIQKLNNSRAKRKRNHSCEGVFIFDKDTQNFYLDFFGIYNIYIENSLARNFALIVRLPLAFYNLMKHSCSCFRYHFKVFFKVFKYLLSLKHLVCDHQNLSGLSEIVVQQLNLILIVTYLEIHDYIANIITTR